MRSQELVASIIAVLLAVTSSYGQAARYVMSPDDTARYHELTRGMVEMEVPQGVVEVASIHDAVISITLEAHDTARAWYDSLYISQEGSGRVEEPETADLLGRPFTLLIEPTGRVELISLPEIPPEIAAMTEIGRQFEDFFIALPPGEMAVGTAWADTVTGEGATRPSDTYSARHVRNYHVDRDTMIAGEKAFVIAVEQGVTLEASSPMPTEGLTASIRLTGRDHGFAIFDPVAGHLLYRTRDGLLEGEMRITGGPQPVVVPQRYRYESAIERL